MICCEKRIKIKINSVIFETSQGVPNRAEITPIEPGQVMLPRDIFSTTRIISPFIRIK